MLTQLTRLARRALMGVAAVLTLAAPAAAEPALWAIKDEDSTIYIFGTFHVLRPGVDWRSAKVERAFADSQDLVLEVVGADDAAAMQPLIPKYGVDPYTPLSSRLEPADRARLAAAAQSLGAQPQALEPLRPWLASMTLSTAPLFRSGYDPKAGVELTLTASAKAAGKPISGLETIEQQIRIMAGMPAASELAMLTSTLRAFDDVVPLTDRLMAAWAAADLATLEKEFLAEDSLEDRAVYEAMLARRNRDWADQLKARLAGKGVTFVAVGAGHLVGPDSLQVELEKRGIKVERR